MKLKIWFSVLAAMFATAAPVAAHADSHGSFGNDRSDRADTEAAAEVEDDAIRLDVEVTTPATEGSEPEVTGADEQVGPAPDGYWISWWTLDMSQDPPCLRQTGELITAASREEADLVGDHRDNRTVADWEAYAATSGNTAPTECPAPTGVGSPGSIGDAAQRFADSAVEQLPVAAPTISGGKAITGLRSWLDLGRPTTHSIEERLNPGPFDITASLTATATSTVAWGDGTVTTHTTRGGGYHEGEPGSADIVHTYTDAAAGNTLTVTDTWEIIVTGPGFDDIVLTWTAPPVGITFDIDEVRSSRDR